jgi:hypothetical protein
VYTRGLTLIIVLLTFAAGERHGGYILLSDGRLQEQSTWAEADELRTTVIPAAGK